MSRPPAPCGTTAAYLRHRRHGEEACRACKDAKATESRTQQRTARKAARRRSVATVEELTALPAGAILADRWGRALQRMGSGAFWVLGERWPHLPSEVLDRGPFLVLAEPKDGAS